MYKNRSTHNNNNNNNRVLLSPKTPPQQIQSHHSSPRLQHKRLIALSLSTFCFLYLILLLFLKGSLFVYQRHVAPFANLSVKLHSIGSYLGLRGSSNRETRRWNLIIKDELMNESKLIEKLNHWEDILVKEELNIVPRKYKDSAFGEGNEDDGDDLAGLDESEFVINDEHSDKSARLALVIFTRSHKIFDTLNVLKSWTHPNYSPCIHERNSLSNVADIIILLPNEEEMNEIKPMLILMEDLLVENNVVGGIEKLGNEAKDNDHIHKTQPCLIKMKIGHLNMEDKDATIENLSLEIYGKVANHQFIQSGKYTHFFWMDSDMYAVKRNWLTILLKECKDMANNGIWMKGPMDARFLGSEKDASKMLSANSLYSIESEAFKGLIQILNLIVTDGSTGSIYSSFISSGESIVSRLASKFQFTQSMADQPDDLCVPDLKSYSQRHPGVYFAHSKYIGKILAGSQCCKCFPESIKAWRLGSPILDSQQKCLSNDRGSIPISQLGVVGGAFPQLGEISNRNGIGKSCDQSHGCDWGLVCNLEIQLCVQVCKDINPMKWNYDNIHHQCKCSSHPDCLSNRCNKQEGICELEASPYSTSLICSSS